MRIDVAAPDAWGRLSERYRAALPENLQDPGLNILVFNGITHAITEVTKSLAQLFAHKKTIAIVSSIDPGFEPVAVAFSQDEFQVKVITPEQAKDVATWTPLMDELLFVLVAEDDPITGKLTDLSGLNEAMKGKRVFKILVSHALHRLQPVSRPEPFGVRLLSLTTNRALLVGGERCRIQPTFAASLHWDHETDAQIAERLLNVQSPANDRKSEIQSFEAKLPSGFKPYFASDTARVFDRSVFFHPDFDGLAVIEELAQTMKQPIGAVGEESALETTSGCRWESPRFQAWLGARGDSEATIRGLIVARADLLAQGLAMHLETAAAKIHRLQNGD